MFSLTLLFISILVSSALLITVAQNPIHSLLLLIALFCAGSILLLVIGLEYFALLFLIVYVGAIVVLFLFLIMILELKVVNVSYRFTDVFSIRSFLLNGFVAVLLILLASDFGVSSSRFVMYDSTWWLPFESAQFIDWGVVLSAISFLRVFGALLFTEYSYTLLLVAVLLFVAIAGAIVVTIPVAGYSTTSIIHTAIQHTSIKFQDPNLQALRHPAFALRKLCPE